MAQYDITEAVNRILALGGTEAQVRGCAARIVSWKGGTEWEAQNRASLTAVLELRGRFEAADAKRKAAAETIEKIRNGSVLYTKTRDGQWLIWGREDLIVTGKTVTPERRDGSTQAVVITQTGPVMERDGLKYRTAGFRAPMDDLTDGGMTGPAAEALRIGRSYGVNGQVWDNA